MSDFVVGDKVEILPEDDNGHGGSIGVVKRKFGQYCWIEIGYRTGISVLNDHVRKVKKEEDFSVGDTIEIFRGSRRVGKIGIVVKKWQNSCLVSIMNSATGSVIENTNVRKVSHDTEI